MRRKGEQRGYIRKIGKVWHVEYSDWVQADGKIEYKPVSRKVGPATGPDALTKRGAQKEAYDRFVSQANGPAAIADFKRSHGRTIGIEPEGGKMARAAAASKNG